MKVSIIIPCRNAGDRLIECVRSCSAQTQAGIEVILIDNGSADDSIYMAEKLLELYDIPFKIEFCEKVGANNARNMGYSLSTGEYIQWLDADDTIEPDKIERQVRFLEREESIDIAYSDWRWVFYDKKLHFKSEPHEDFITQTLIDNWHPPHSYLLRRAAADHLHQIQAWNPATTILMDREYFTLAALSGYQFGYVAGAKVSYYSWSANQLSHSTSRQDRNKSAKLLQKRFSKYAESLSPSQKMLVLQSQSLYAVTENSSWPSHLNLNEEEFCLVKTIESYKEIETLEELSRKIMRTFWQTFVEEQLLNEQVEQLMSRIAHSNSRPKMRNSRTDDKQLTENLRIETSTECFDKVNLMRQVPLYAPIFCEARSSIQRTLEILAEKGFLHEVCE